MSYVAIHRYPPVSTGFHSKDFLGLQTRFLSFLSLSEKPVDSGGFLPVDSGGWYSGGYRWIQVDTGGLATNYMNSLLTVIGYTLHSGYALVLRLCSPITVICLSSFVGWRFGFASDQPPPSAIQIPAIVRAHSSLCLLFY